MLTSGVCGMQLFGIVASSISLSLEEETDKSRVIDLGHLLDFVPPIFNVRCRSVVSSSSSFVMVSL